MSRGKGSGQSICWDCANATGNCSWSAALEPVEGWKVKKGKRIASDGIEYTAHTVLACPQFVRDAWQGGQIRIDDED